MEKALYDSKDLRRMGFSKYMVYKLLKRSDLPVIKIGERKYMLKEHFDKWLQQQNPNRGDINADSGNDTD